MKAWQYIKSKAPKRHCHYDNGTSVYLDVIITTKPLSMYIEIPHDHGTDVYEIDMSTITPNTLFSKIKAKAYYLNTKSQTRR